MTVSILNTYSKTIKGNIKLSVFVSTTLKNTIINSATFQCRQKLIKLVYSK